MKPLIARGGSARRSNPNQLHETEEAGTLALLLREGRRMRTISPGIWEPACGRGRMSRVLSGAGFKVTSTDLVDRGFGEAPLDFLKTRKRRAPIVVTNPPYGEMVERFIRHAAGLGAEYLALLVKSDFFQATEKEKRHVLFGQLPPSRIHPLGFRLDWTGQGSPVMSCMWVVWDWSAALGGGRLDDSEPRAGRGLGGAPVAQFYPPVSKAEALNAMHWRWGREAT
ncbi:hypothetical protein [Parvibaculum sp.]|uniref:hypothetical protein n=1 Tax=Parvibaculum sp. TaxID=2024848 RepID=UPI003919CCAF